MANQYPNSGSLFTRDKRSPKSADFGGDFTIDAEVLEYVLQEAQRGNSVKLEVSGWKRQGRNNTNFLSLKIEVPYKQRQAGGQGQANRGGQRGGYGEQSGGRGPVLTSQGRYPQQNYREGVQSRGTPQNQRMRDELNDEIPFGNGPQRDDSNPWD